MEIDNIAALNIFSDFLQDLQVKRRGVESTYEVVGEEEEQATDYRTKEPLWEDEEHTIPMHRKIWDYVPKTFLNDEDKRQIYTIGKIEKELMKLIGKVAG